jgi:hypothetical protein
MRTRTRTAVSADPLEVVAALVETGIVDTVYRDVYLHRARTLMAGVLPVEEFRRLEHDKADLAALPVAIGRALDRAEWGRVKELSSRGEALRRAAEGHRREMEAARTVYAVTDVRLDPFSPGLLQFTRLAARDLAALRAHAVDRLAELARADAPWSEFYAERRAAIQAVRIDTGETSPAAAALDPRQAAERALKAGDMAALARLADVLASATAPAAGAPDAGVRDAPRAAAPELLTDYDDGTLVAARRLGLAPRRLEARTELASLRQYAWNPLVPDDAGQVRLKDVRLPAGTPEGLRDRLEMLVIHPIINSGGARHLPTLVAEDVLIEDFPDPPNGDEAPVSELLTLLGLPRRRGVPRAAIEQALLAHGARILEDRLGLDPRVHRLVCIPPDVHLRLGETEGWGRAAFWTHFDGYLVMADGRLRALAGGDVRFGGLFNLLGISRDYDSDRLMTRFAVVRRARMVAW